MISTFDLTKLSDLLKDFYNIANIRITVLDDSFRELASYPEHIAPVCQVIRTDPDAANMCMECDRRACETASHRHRAYTYHCHAGLTESISTIYMGNIVIGYLLFGHVFSYSSHEDGWKIIQKCCASYRLDQAMFKAAVYECPIIPETYITSASHILEAVASYLCLERMVSLRQNDLPVQIDEYITNHYTEDIDTADLCEQFQIGKTSLYEIAKKNYGMGIAEHIRILRIEKAKEMLLEHPEMRISEISSACGFVDYNYFITVFKRIAGQPPKQYRTANI